MTLDLKGLMMNNDRIKMLALLAPLSVFALAGITGCEEDDTTFEEMGEDLDEGVDETEDAIDDAGDEMEDDLDDIGDELEHDLDDLDEDNVDDGLGGGA
jgi:hypothetical protein